MNKGVERREIGNMGKRCTIPETVSPDTVREPEDLEVLVFGLCKDNKYLKTVRQYRRLLHDSVGRTSSKITPEP